MTPDTCTKLTAEKQGSDREIWGRSKAKATAREKGRQGFLEALPVSAVYMSFQNQIPLRLSRTIEAP